MVICMLRVYTYPFRLSRLFVTAVGATTCKKEIIVSIEADDGTTGWGEASPHAQILSVTPGTILATLEVLAPILLGEDPRALTAEGVTTLEIRAGRDPGTDVEALRAVPKAVGSSVVLRIDANESWNRQDAVFALRRMEELDLQSVERPLAARDLEGLAMLRRRTMSPVMADESVFGPGGRAARHPRGGSRLHPHQAHEERWPCQCLSNRRPRLPGPRHGDPWRGGGHHSRRERAEGRAALRDSVFWPEDRGARPRGVGAPVPTYDITKGKEVSVGKQSACNTD